MILKSTNNKGGWSGAHPLKPNAQLKEPLKNIVKNNILKKLEEQTRPDPEIVKANEDRRILKTIRSFVTKQTNEYLDKINKKEWSTVWYYGVKASLAGVDYNLALDFVKAEFPNWNSEALETEFSNAYSSVEFDQKRRDWYFNKK